MASDDNDQDAKYALSKLFQMGTVEDYQRELEMLIKRVTIPESLLKSFYISGLKLDLQCEFASPKAKGSLNADKYIGVEEVVGGGEVLGIGEDDDLGDAATDEGDDAVESGDISILNSLIGHGSPRSLQLWGKIGKGDVHVLIENGSTHNFIRPDVVEKLCLPTHFTKVFKVYIGRGETLLCENMCAHVASEIQGLRIKVDLYVLMMKGMLRRRQQQQIATNAKIQR
ncbi:retrovirus-related pol polyprotein from transposon 297 family protein [Tanacetum coccineum]